MPLLCRIAGQGPLVKIPQSKKGDLSSTRFQSRRDESAALLTALTCATTGILDRSAWCRLRLRNMTNYRFDIPRLLRHEVISNEPPWSSGDEGAIDEHLKNLIQKLECTLGVKTKSEWDHYGSGYASYVDTWVYHATDEFRIGKGDHYCGLIVLLSRLSNCYVLGQGEKVWSGGGSSSYLPCFEHVDQFDHAGVRELAAAVETALSGCGLNRLSRESVEDFLPAKLTVPTILTNPPFRVFDALFHWED